MGYFKISPLWDSNKGYISECVISLISYVIRYLYLGHQTDRPGSPGLKMEKCQHSIPIVVVLYVFIKILIQWNIPQYYISMESNPLITLNHPRRSESNALISQVNPPRCFWVSWSVIRQLVHCLIQDNSWTFWDFQVPRSKTFDF